MVRKLGNIMLLFIFIIILNAATFSCVFVRLLKKAAAICLGFLRGILAVHNRFLRRFR